MSFTFVPLELPGVIMVEPKQHGDDRGFFLESYKRSEFIEGGIAEEFVQDNVSRSARGILRGLHYQLSPKAQGKLVSVTRGEVFDVAVDIRKESPTYAEWISVTLSGDEPKLLYIPPGFAHGFCVLSDDADFCYKCTDEYDPALDRGIIWNDPTIAVDWPIDNPVLSDKDKQLPLLDDADNNFVF